LLWLSATYAGEGLDWPVRVSASTVRYDAALDAFVLGGAYAHQPANGALSRPAYGVSVMPQWVAANTFDQPDGQIIPGGAPPGEVYETFVSGPCTIPTLSQASATAFRWPEGEATFELAAWSVQSQGSWGGEFEVPPRFDQRIGAARGRFRGVAFDVRAPAQLGSVPGVWWPMGTQVGGRFGVLFDAPIDGVCGLYLDGTERVVEPAPGDSSGSWRLAPLGCDAAHSAGPAVDVPDPQVTSLR
jgi:hypothetical protein